LRKLAAYGSKNIIFLLLMFGCFNNASILPPFEACVIKISSAILHISSILFFAVISLLNSPVVGLENNIGRTLREHKKAVLCRLSIFLFPFVSKLRIIFYECIFSGKCSRSLLLITCAHTPWAIIRNHCCPLSEINSLNILLLCFFGALTL